MKAILTLCSAFVAACTFGQAGSNDPTFNPVDDGSGHGADATITAMVAQPDGKVLLGGYFSSMDNAPRNKVARIHADGTLDTSFDPGTGVPDNDHVNGLALQPDGKVIVVGRFTSFNGTPHSSIVRLNNDGSTDPGFSSPFFNATIEVNCIVLQPDGNMLVGGSFPGYNGVAPANLVRLHADGSLDPTFNPNGAGTVGTVYTITLLTESKVLICGNFPTYNGIGVRRTARLFADGTLDTTYAADLDGPVFAASVSANGRILVGGDFATCNGTPRHCMALLYPNGDLVPDYDPGELLGYSIQVQALLQQAGGKVIVAGYFKRSRGAARSCILRINGDGSLDESFNPNGAGASAPVGLDLTYGGSILAVALVGDHKLMVAGHFNRFNSSPLENLARLNHDGTVDRSYAPKTGVNAPVSGGLAIYPDGRVLIGGNFNAYNGIKRNQLARLTPDGELDPSFHHSGSLRGELYTLVLQPDDKVLVGGKALHYPGMPGTPLMRFNSDGSVDPTFHNGFNHNGGQVQAMAFQPDGKILVGGRFSNYDGFDCNGLIRLNSDGTFDPTFVPPLLSVPPILVYALALQADGKIIHGGDYYRSVSYPGANIARTLANGSPDTTFNPEAGPLTPNIKDLLLLPDGKILVSGVTDLQKVSLYRLDDQGAVDPAFDTGALLGFGSVTSIAEQADGKILVSRGFSVSTPAAFVRRLIRLLPDGSEDLDFQPGTGANNTVQAVALQSDGRAILMGDFTRYDGAGRNYIARVVLDGDGFAPQENRSLEVAHGTGLFPNPAQGPTTHLRMDRLDPQAEVAHLQLVNVTGEVISRMEFPVVNGVLDTELDLGNTADGIYLLHVVAGGRSRSERLVVRR